jgi:hypothetical protein
VTDPIRQLILEGKEVSRKEEPELSHSLRILEEIMRADSSKNISTPYDLESEAVGSGDASLPYLPRVLHLFDL